jgi:hypothetical protein
MNCDGPGRKHMPVILELRRLKQEYCEFKANLAYIVSPFPTKRKEKKKHKQKT